MGAEGTGGGEERVEAGWGGRGIVVEDEGLYWKPEGKEKGIWSTSGATPGNGKGGRGQ